MLDITEIKNRGEQAFPGLVQTLKDLVAIPSVSSQPNNPAMAQSAQAVARLFKDLGLEVTIRQAPTPDGTMGMPAVVAKRFIDKSKPTVLLYAHHDVQPTGPLDRWDTDPFMAEEKDGRLYGRGASDDGAGIIVHLGALALLGEDCPVNVTCYIEGEEEIGSPSFRNFLEENLEDLKADVIVIADSNNWRVGQPALTASLRGVCTVDVDLKILDHALHSGAYGGPILDAVTLSSILISKLFNEDGSVAVPGLGGSEQAEVHYPDELFITDAGLVPGAKLAGRGDLAARLWHQPSINVIGWDQRDIATSANAIQPETSFRLSMRVAPGMDSTQAAEKLCAFLEAQVPFGAQIKTSIRDNGPSYQDPGSPAKADMEWALEAAWGVPPVNIGCGGAIPMTADFKAVLPEASILITGVEDPATNAHSENESQDLGDLKKAIIAEALLLARTGKLV